MHYQLYVSIQILYENMILFKISIQICLYCNICFYSKILLANCISFRRHSNDAYRDLFMKQIAWPPLGPSQKEERHEILELI